MMNNEIYLRKWRWTIEGDFPGGTLKKKFIKLNSRPLQGIADITIFDVVNWSQEDLLILQSSIYKNEIPELSIFKLTLYDGIGDIMEEWELIDAYISIFEFNDYDESSSDETSILMKINYKEVNYKKFTDIKPMGIHIKCPKCEHEFLAQPAVNF